MKSSINGIGGTTVPPYGIIKTGTARPPPASNSLSNREALMIQEKTERPQKEFNLNVNMRTSAPVLSQPITNMVKTGPGLGNTSPQSSNGLNTTQQLFSLRLQDSIDPTDPSITTIWTYNIPVLATNEKQLILDFIGGQIMILQSASPDFPQQVFLFCDQLSGYLDTSGNPTHAVAIFRVKQIFQMLNGGVTTYTIVYCLCDPMSWPLGLTRTLTFSVGDRNSTYGLPLTSAVHCDFRIMHVSY